MVSMRGSLAPIRPDSIAARQEGIGKQLLEAKPELDLYGPDGLRLVVFRWAENAGRQGVMALLDGNRLALHADLSWKEGIGDWAAPGKPRESLQVTNIHVMPGYEGRRLAVRSYLRLAAAGQRMVSDFEQTPAGRRIWDDIRAMAPRLGLEVNAWHVARREAGPADELIRDVYAAGSLYLLAMEPLAPELRAGFRLPTAEEFRADEVEDDVPVWELEDDVDDRDREP